MGGSPRLGRRPLQEDEVDAQGEEKGGQGARDPWDEHISYGGKARN